MKQARATSAKSPTVKEKKASTLALFAFGAAQAHAIRERDAVRGRTAKLTDEVACIAEGRPLSSRENNLTYINSLEVAPTERGLVSSDGNFDLVRRMIAEKPHLKGNLRFQIS